MNNSFNQGPRPKNNTQWKIWAIVTIALAAFGAISGIDQSKGQPNFKGKPLHHAR